MSHLLWKYYWDNDVDKFCRLLAPAGYSQNSYSTPSKGSGVGSPGSGTLGSSPRVATKSRKASAYGTGGGLSKADVNSRDHAGLTILLRAASSTQPNAAAFAEALISHPSIDLYAIDTESGWNALHRSLYNGNISIARLLLDKERRDLTESLSGSTAKIGQLIKTKDHEGMSPFDVYNATIALRTLRMADKDTDSGDESDVDENPEETGHTTKTHGLGEELFVWGSNKNLSLGLGDEDDRQYPERVYIKRPDHLIQYFYDNFLQDQSTVRNLEESFSADHPEVPTLIQNRPLVIQDVVLEKLHTAILTTDPISNLYVAGIGRGGRLGLGDENTQFSFKPVQGGLLDKKVVQVALGVNHTMAITSTGELWTWGNNAYSQLGYTLPVPIKQDEDPMSVTPRQVFGPLKKEVVLGIAASSIHSVVHTGTSLLCFGKNEGQLGIMDADSRSLPVQSTPRRVAASLLSSHSAIRVVSAIDRATACLFEDSAVCVFTSYGYSMVKFPFFDGFTNSVLQRSGGISISSRYDSGRREIGYITSGGDTIAALTNSGDVFTLALNNKPEGNATATATSTTNPSKIKDSLTIPKQIWSSRSDSASSVAVSENGSVILSTGSGAVWQRVQRTKAKDNKKRKDFKFQRVPYVTGVARVRSSAWGTFAAVRKDCDVTKDQIEVDDQTLWSDVAPLCALDGFRNHNSRTRDGINAPKLQNAALLRDNMLAYQILTSNNFKDDLEIHLRDFSFSHENLGYVICASSAPEVQIPVHSWVLSARSPVLRAGLQQLSEFGTFAVPEVLNVSRKDAATIIIELLGVDLITLVNLITYSYGDELVPSWSFTSGQAPPTAQRYRQIRVELMKLATKLGMSTLELDARLQRHPSQQMDKDYLQALSDPDFFADADAVLELDDGEEVLVHSTMMCQRCPFFQGLFNGRSGGAWLDSRRAGQVASDRIPIDMKHLNPESFHYVLQYLYADVGEELFDLVVADSIDDFSELVMDVMSIANELMLDRLSSICQKTLGRFVLTRNVSTLLNLISPCSVTEFKDKALEYICLQMETMLENHLLDDLDEELIKELDEVCRDNQLARCPFARSDRAYICLSERHPDLDDDIKEERRLRVKEMAYKTALREDEKKLSSSFKTRFGSLEDAPAVSLASPSFDKSKWRPKTSNEPFASPNLRPKDSHVDLMFNMDPLEEGIPVSPSPRPVDLDSSKAIDQLPKLGKSAQGDSYLISSPPAAGPLPSATPSNSPNYDSNRKPTQGGNPWGSAVLSTSRLDLREVTAPKPSASALSAGLAAEKKDAAAKATFQKLSQKDRKKFLQQQAELAALQEAEASQKSTTPWAKAAEKKDPPWKSAPVMPKTSLKEAMSSEPKPSMVPPGVKPLVAAEASPSTSIPHRAASPDTKFSGQKNRSGSSTPRGPASRANFGENTPPVTKARSSQAAPSQQAQSEIKSLVPHSKSYIQKAPRQTEVSGLGLADIIGLQQREQESVKDYAAKRSLQEIQQEQAFQEWWDLESRRTQEEEARKAVPREKTKGDRSSRRGNKSVGKSNKGGRAAGNPHNAELSRSAAMHSTPARVTGSGSRGGRGRGDKGTTKA